MGFFGPIETPGAKSAPAAGWLAEDEQHPEDQHLEHQYLEDQHLEKQHSDEQLERPEWFDQADRPEQPQSTQEPLPDNVIPFRSRPPREPTSAPPASAPPSTPMAASADGALAMQVPSVSSVPSAPPAPSESPVPSALPVASAPPVVSTPPVASAPPVPASAPPAPASAPPAPASTPPASVSAPPVPVSGTPVSGSPAAGTDTVRPAPTGVAAGAATALSAPTMLAPIVRPGRVAEEPPASTPDEAPAEPEGPDPEQVLSSYNWRFHHETLRELVEEPDELREIRDRLTAKLETSSDNPTRARLLSLRAVVSRILGDLAKALSDGKLALAHAEATGELRRIAIAQARLAHVLEWRGDFAEADRLFELANSPELPDRLRATMHEHAGRSSYDQGRYIEACNHFEHALELRKVEDPDLIARTEVALDAVFRKVAENGWGPYPRGRDEILRLRRPPVPAFDERANRWGFADESGELVIAPGYADVQPFRDDVAWVRRPESETWELIDEEGKRLIEAHSSYLGVGSFSDGLAWVSRDGNGGWIAIDKTNQVVIGSGFDDVRPFRRGVAAVRKGGWGAVDSRGKVLVPFIYHGFATALTDGRYMDGFTDEGLAIVDEGGRKGVVDRTGQVIVRPAHPAVVIHPVAFLIAAPNGRWGALDRKGRPLIEPKLPSRAAVMDEIDRLLADTKPVL